MLGKATVHTEEASRRGKEKDHTVDLVTLAEKESSSHAKGRKGNGHATRAINTLSSNVYAAEQ